MARAPITLGSETFRTKEALKARIRGIVAAHADDETLNAEEFSLIRALLERHRRRSEKVGCGVTSIEVRTNWPGPTRGFWLTRADGTCTDFSWLDCVDGKAHRKDVLGAMRVTVIEQVQEFRKAWFASHPECRCPLTGTPISPDECHVDHIPPDTFDALATRFLEANALDVESIAVDGFGDGRMARTLSDPALRAAWSEFHRPHARLRVVSRLGNLSISRRAANAGQPADAEPSPGRPRVSQGHLWDMGD